MLVHFSSRLLFGLDGWLWNATLFVAWRRQNMAWVVPKEHFLPLHALSHNGICRYRYFSVSFFCDLQLCSGNNKVSVCDT